MREQRRQAATPQRYFTVADLQELFGVTESRINRWLVKGLFGELELEIQVPREGVERFIRQEPQRFRLAKVDQARFRDLIFPSMHQRRGLAKNRTEN